MTREKAIKILSSYKNSYFGDALHGGVISVSEIIELLSAQTEIIRCKDCKFYHEYGCQREFVYPEPEDFCSRAERRTDGRD